jgi:hypothetical protein
MLRTIGNHLGPNSSCADILRIRKVKCDEEKPHCKRCTSTGRTCDGYDPNFRPSSHSPSTSPAPSQGHLQPGRELTRSHSPVPLAPALRLKTVQEQDNFEFFITHAVSSLRGFLDSPFWQREILQAANQYESIRHCIVALGAMHRRFYEGRDSHINEADMTDQHLQFALRQSNQAIQGLIKATSPGGHGSGVDKVTLMACCILFSSMACLQGHQKEGLQHLRSGIRMLNEVDEEDNKSHSHPIDVESLRSVFVGLDMQARSIMPTAEASNWEPTPRTKEPDILLHVDVNDRSLLAMQRYLQALLNRTLAFLQASLGRSLDERDDVYQGYRRLLARFHHGTKVLENLCAKATQSASDFTQPLIALQLLHSQLEYFMQSPRPDLEAKFEFMTNPFEEPFDAAAHFTRLLDLATQLLPHSSSLSPVFTTSSGPLQALWLIASRAPSQCLALRRRAVELMLSYPRREGFWDGLVAGQIAQEVLRLEQESAQREMGMSLMPIHDVVVPAELRIIVVALVYDEQDDRKARVEYKNAQEVARGVPGQVQHLAW